MARRADQQRNLFRDRPIRFDGFTLGPRGVVVEGQPSIEKWMTAFDFALASSQASPWWVAGLWSYAENRPEYKDSLMQALADIGQPLSEKALRNMAYVERHVTGAARELSPSFAHAAEVADLEPLEQLEWMDKATTEGYTRNELRAHVRAAKRRRVLTGQASLRGLFRVIYADPPWRYSQTGSSAAGKDGVAAANQYEGMSIEELCKLPVGAHALPNAVLLMWVTASHLYENPGPREVMEAWGFAYKTNLVWDKVLGNPGSYGLQVSHEHLVIATRGDGMPDVPTPHDYSVFTDRRTSVHSAKPKDMVRFIERHWTIGPHLELFGREPRDGWTVYGDDAALWGAD